MEPTNASIKVPQLNLDTNAQRVFVNFIALLGEKPSTMVRFFKRSDCYSVHGTDDCDLLANMIYKSTAYIQLMLANEPKQLPYVTMSKFKFEQALREILLVRNLRVEVYVRETASGDWQCEYRGSPGNLLQFEDILFANKEELVGTGIMSLQMCVEGGHRRLGIAAVDQNDCQFQVVEFVDDDFFTELEATIVLLGPKECLLPVEDGEYAGVKILLERNGILVTVIKKSNTAKENDLVQDLNHLLRFQKGQQEDSSTLPEIQLALAAEALRVTIKYLDLVNDPSNLGHCNIKQLNLKRFVHLDAAAVSALNILPKAGIYSNSRSYRWQSVLGVLDHCRTPQGHRLMLQWVKQPLRSLDVLNDRHTIVQTLLEAPDTLSSLHDDFLKRIPDILLLTKKLMRRKATLMDLFRIYQVVLRTPKMLNVLWKLDSPTIRSVFCDPMENLLKDLGGVKRMVEQTVDFEAIETGEYLVKGSFDEELLEIKSHMIRLQENMQHLQQKTHEDLKLEHSQQVRLENVSHIGYHFRITLKDDSVLRKNKNYKILDVVKGGVRFINAKLTEYNAEFTTLRAKYEEQQKSIVEEIIQVAIGYVAPLTSLNNEVAQLDCLVSFAIAARSAPIPYVRPQMLDEGAGVLTLNNIRHPCLELQEHRTFIANSVEFQKNDCNMFIITGPNMGGKSTYIRSVGISVLMAHVGSFVPCTAATISMIDSIFGRVGADDNVIKGLSTFMLEMIETASIVRSATEKSLVIIDELGRGTSTYEGCGIAWSIAEYLAKEKKCFTLFATHFHEITKLSEMVFTVKNCHMAAVANEQDFTLLYQVQPGPMQRSFGIQVARLANFADAIVNNAQEIYNEFEDEHNGKKQQEDEKLLEKMNAAIQQLSTTGNNVDINENELFKLVEQFTRDINELDSEYFEAKLAEGK